MSMESLINLDTLTEEERKIILSVLKKDDELKRTQDKKIGHLKLEIQAIRMKSVLRNGDDLSKICARCHAELGFLFNRGDLCPKCHFRVCRACQEQGLAGTWLCTLCHKQRQLKFFMEEWNKKGKTTKKTGTDLVKASMVKQRRPGRVNDDTSQVEKSRGVQNGNPVQNGTSFRSKKEAENERIEYPNDSDKRKLSQLFDTFKLGKTSEKTEHVETKHQVSVKKLTTKRYDDSDESSSSDDDRSSRDSTPNVTHRMTDTRSADDFVTVSNLTRGVLQRNYSDDSDQTAMSDETPFMKNTGSTETQIRVDIHSDSSGTTPKKIKPSKFDQETAGKIKDHKSNHIHDQVARTGSMSSYRSTSPENIDTPQLQKRQAYQQNRSPSPYSFDSIPSSHADSPLSKKRFSTELYRQDSDADSRVSGVSGISGTAEHSGTESLVKDSGEEDYTVEELSNIRFRRVSRKNGKSQRSSEHKADSITKLSPRASSEGSASLEDSGHVSGASTQENTPEHRRTDSLQSQASMASSKLSTLTDKESEEDPDIDELVRSHRSLNQGSMGGSRGNLLSAMTESRESIVSFYSNAGDVDYGKIPITGDIQFGMDYNYRTGTLEIHITQCKGLAPADTRRNRSDPYIKTYLLPDKTRSGKRKTKIKKHTLNPVFDEKLRYLISKSELENRTLWVTVWHNDRFGRNDFLGEVTINFDYYRFGDSASKWYKLQERFEQPTSLLTYKGDIILCLKYVPAEKVNRDSDSPSPSRKKARKPKLPGDKGQLHVLIKEARNLTAVRSNGYSDPFCKGQLQPDKEKQKTQVIKKECNPAWNCTMVFEDVTAENLREKSLELTIWDHDKLSSNDFLGGVRLNLGTGKSYSKLVDWMDARGEEISLWQAMVDRPNFWIDGALVLRSTMSKRK
ncbi:synaptotagmin-like protein [Mytilus galloprovincialis]|uniref:Synaptotagmin-like protein n=1 Tax=Mytilus galloprovincialis TaxID=29158 RepID=A0A8B6C1P2_MYTGA|nr:synaptotagmin-like protein [Mytilus galloprovincialis]